MTNEDRYYRKAMSAQTNQLRLDQSHIEGCGTARPGRAMNARQYRREKHWDNEYRRQMDKYWEAL